MHAGGLAFNIEKKRSTMNTLINEAQTPDADIVSHVFNRPKVGVKVRHREEDIEENVAELIAEISKAGIATSVAWQENEGGKVEIAFDYFEDLERFVDILVEDTTGPDMLRDRITGQNGNPKDYWIVTVSAQDCERQFDDEPSVSWFITVEFSPKDVPCVLYRLQRHNAGASCEPESDTQADPVTQPAPCAAGGDSGSN